MSVGGDLSHAQTQVQGELQRVRALRQQLQNGGSDQDGAIATISNDSVANALGGSAEETTPIAETRANKVVGHTASTKSKLPGQVTVSVGSIARAVLDQEVISDYEGPWRGMVIDDVYDVNKRFIVIPKGSRITGHTLRIHNVNEPIQARMGLLTDWFVLPDGSKISLDRSKALDAMGVAAIKDQVNRHLVAQVLGVGAYALLSSESSRQGSSIVQDTSLAGDLGDSLRKQFAPMAEKYLQLVPTITLHSGTPIRIFIEDEIYAYPWGEVNAELVNNIDRSSRG